MRLFLHNNLFHATIVPPLSRAGRSSTASSGVLSPHSHGRPSNSRVRVVAERGLRVGRVGLRCVGVGRVGHVGVGRVGVGRMGATRRRDDELATAGARGTLAVDALGRGHSGYAGGVNRDGEFNFAVGAGVGCSLGRLAVWVRARDVRRAGCRAKEGEGSGSAGGGAGDVLLQEPRQYV